MQDNIQDFRRHSTLQMNSIFDVDKIISLLVLHSVLYHYVKVSIIYFVKQLYIDGFKHDKLSFQMVKKTLFSV